MGLPNVTYIDSYIKDSELAVMNLKNFYETLLVSDVDNRRHTIRIPINDFFLKYRSQLESSATYYNMTDNYFYKPKTLSYDLYDTTEMWLSLLRLNSMRNIIEFNKSIIKIYNPYQVKNLINIFFKREGIIS